MSAREPHAFTLTRGIALCDPPRWVHSNREGAPVQSDIAGLSRARLLSLLLPPLLASLPAWWAAQVMAAVAAQFPR